MMTNVEKAWYNKMSIYIIFINEQDERTGK